ncbi:long-chain fatty acid--CoA ligase [Salinadaptatus halalkaliphilus]|uniref:Long-chain fatty acid--CoA ligase n=1 Tax=Salinadaptatus halalkaliphilus TaxID=2419781 RepID=A0A4S3TNA7_9EURY|nr:long-chain fatty acid--CoA ligase [Salinadaptatus halalkaliphilus]THE65789.1 long-chain fatty acid--CoA ligase [Salinadaptatus halalkaliphilus]
MAKTADDDTAEGIASTDLVTEVEAGPALSVPDGPMAAWLEDHFEAYADEPAALIREGDSFEDVRFAELLEEARAVAGGLLELGLEPGDRIGIRAPTRYEWSVADVATHLAGLVLVPVYPSFSADQATHVVDDADASVLITEDDYPDELEDAVDEIVPIDDLPTAEPPELAGYDADDDEPATIIYTSGTTGDPKGCTITHRNLLAATAMVDERLSLESGNVGTCFLPLSHIYQRVGNYYLWGTGNAAAFMTVDDLKDELGMVEPELLVTVPRVYRRVYAGIQDQIAEMSGAKRRLMEWADGVAKAYGEGRSEGESVSSALAAKHALAEKLVFSTLREELGLTQVEYALTGAASIDADLLHYFWGLGIPLVEVYGSTEVTGPSTMNKPDSFRAGTVGYPMAGSEVGLAADGEVLYRGPNVMEGYWNNEAATADSIVDGWYHTGDIGEFDEDGFLTIVDRKKRMAVLDTGKNVSPNRVETALNRDRFVADSMAIADGRKFVTALLQPNYEAVLDLATDEGIAFDESATERDDSEEVVAVDPALLEDDHVHERFETALESANETLASYEEVGDYRLLERALSVDREELTPTLKKRRPTIEERYADRIESMYAE